MSKASELRGKDAAGLTKELQDLLKAQFSVRMQAATQQLQDTSKLQTVRRGIARVRTLMSQQMQMKNAQGGA